VLLAFHLGRVYTLSLAEILAVFARKQIPYTIKALYTEVLLLQTDVDIDLPSLQKRLGGTIKIIEILDEVPRKKKTDFVSYSVKNYFTSNLLKEKFLKAYSGKLQFGISLYSLASELKLFGQNKRVGMDIKAKLTETGASCRLVLPEGGGISLPSVSVTNNHLLEKGAEIDLIVADSKIYIGKTATVQNFADYGRRDYQRPVRDIKAGMLPPKVAQIMLNLAAYSPEERQARGYILDPFCGSGTILQEALLLNFKAIGSDISQKAVDDAEKNLNWFRIRYKLAPGLFEIFTSDASELSEKLEEKKPVAIVTEGSLGPVYVTVPLEKEIEKNFASMAELYVKAFKEFKKILEPGRSVVIALPAYKIGNKYVTFTGIDKILNLGYDIVELMPNEMVKNYPFLKVSPRNSIIYDRKDQIVVREILHFVVK